MTTSIARTVGECQGLVEWREMTGIHLDAKVPSVDVVPEEQVPRISRAPTDFKEFHEVILAQRRGLWVNSQGRINRTRPRTYCPWISPQTRTTKAVISVTAQAKTGVTDL